MEISRNKGGNKGKTIAMGSSSLVRRKLRPKLGRLGIDTVLEARNLGVGFALGRLPTRAIQLGRWATAQKRAKRAARLGGRLGSAVITASAVPSVTYGASTTGMTDGLLAALRSMVAAARGTIRGRSVTARLAMDGSDPGMKVVVQPIADWVDAWWGELVDRSDMADAWKLAVKSVGLSARPNQAVAGGAGAFIAALRRLGGRSPSPDSIMTREGTILYYGDGPAPAEAVSIDPRALKRWMLDEYEMVSLMHSSVAGDINATGSVKGYGRAKEAEDDGIPHPRYYGDTEMEQKAAGIWRRGRYQVIDGMIIPWIWPLARVARSAKRMGRIAAAASLRACVEGGWWTQARLHEAGAASSPICKCGKQIGTLWHRLARCPLTEQVRSEKCDGGLLRSAKAQLWDPLFSRGVPARPKVPPPPSARTWWERGAEGAEFAATGRVYSDGSAQGWHWRAVRAGYAAVCVDDDGRILWTLRGICGEPFASVYRAELRAVLETLRVAVPPLTIHLDNAAVVRGFTRGEAWCTRVGGEASDIWREVWHRWRDIGGGVQIKKVRAHTSVLDIVRGRITEADRNGNAAADKAAKEALAAAKAEAPADNYNTHLARAILWGGGRSWIMCRDG